MSARRNITKLFIRGVLAIVIFASIFTFRAQNVYAAAGVNKVINFQGKVTNTNGTNVTDGVYDFVIKLYDGAASTSTNTFTESWTAAALWSSTMSSAPSSGGESMTYSSNTNESTIKVGQLLWNTTKEESVVVVAVNTTTNVITISPTRQAWATGDTVTNKIYVKDGTFKVAVNSLNQDLSGVNFGTDNVFFGVNFNADGEMKPRIQYTASPYAMNAEKVNGLTVTNTSNNPFSAATTLKIGDGKTFSVANSLAFAGTDSTTITFQGTDTYVGRITTDTLTNKTIGSTGLTFSGAATDVATGTNEDFILTPNGTGKIGFGTFANGPYAFLDLRSTGTVVPIASFSAQTTAAGLVVDNRGAGDLFTASTSGLARFTIKGDGSASMSAGLTFGDGTVTGNVLKTPFGPLSLLYKSAGNAWTAGLTLQDVTGNVGVGTTTPLAKLDVLGDLLLGANSTINARTSGTISLGGGTNTSGISLGKSGGTLTLPNFTGNNAVLFGTTSTGVLASATTSTASQCLLSGASATYLPAWGTCPGGGGGSLSDLTDATGPNTLSNGTNTQTWNWSLTSQSALSLTGGTAMTTGNVFNFGGTFAQSSGNTGQLATFNLVNASTNTIGTAVYSNGLQFNTGFNSSSTGEKNITALVMSSPTLNSCTVGNCFWKGANIFLNDTGSSAVTQQVGFQITPGAGISAGNMYGMRIETIGGGGGAGGEYGLTINSGWDQAITLGASSGLKTQSGLLINGYSYTHVAAETGTVATMLFTDASTNTSGASITNGFDFQSTINTSGAGTKTINGINISNTATACTSGACTWNGLNIMGASASNITSYGLVVDGGSGGGTNYAAVFNNGNVGIGTTAPLGLLQISGKVTGKALFNLNETGDQNIFTASASGATKFFLARDGSASMSGMLTFGDGTLTNNALRTPFGPLSLMYKSAGNAWTAGLTIQDVTGNIGVGTTTPVEKFDVNGNLVLAASGTINARSSGTLSIGNATNTTGITLGKSGGSITLPNFTGNNAVLFATTTTGVLAAATTSTASQCLLSGASATFLPSWGSCSGGGGVRWDQITNPSAANLSLTMGTNLTTFNWATGTSTSNLYSLTTAASANGTGSLLNIQTGASATVNPLRVRAGSVEGLFVDPAGNVGIGTTVPSSKLDIGGDITFTGLDPLLTFNETDHVAWSYQITGDQWIVKRDGADRYVVDAAGNTIIKGNFINNETTDVIIGATASNSRLDLRSNDTTGLYLDEFSNVGVGTTAPVEKLTVNGNVLIDTQPNSSVATQTTWTKVSQATAGTIMSGGTTGIASISASAIYNGSLYVGTHRDGAGSAEIYRYDVTPNTWTKVSQTTAGTIMSGGTSAIGSVSAMTVFDGYLYAGTSKMNGAEVYRYGGGTTWTKVSAATAGTVKTGGTANIDGVASMAVFQGRIYIGTREALSAQVYRYDGGSNWSLINATAGTFVTTNTVGVNAINSMAVYNGNLYLTTEKTADADVIRYLGGGNGGTAGTFLQVEGGTTTSSYNVDGTALTSHNQAIVNVFNGSLIVGLTKANGADLLMMTGVMPGETPVNTFSRLNNATGQMTNGGTTNIDGISSMTVYNGNLFIGTTELNGAEIYRYTGADQKFFKVSQSTAGTIAASGTSGIDAITVLQPTNGDLYAGTLEIVKAEVYKYTANIDKSYSLEFHAEPQIAGGEQGSVENHASIYYVASASANLGSAAGNTGAIVFSHGIQTRNGSYDVAEDYATRDDTLESGDLVSIDIDERTYVRKSTGRDDTTMVGVFSENPALRLSQISETIDGVRAIPVALAGRVPVKVSTENGAIKPGDYLTSSSTPGVAMKASKAGAVIGQAMQGYDEEGIGKITIYIKSSTYMGNIADSFVSIESSGSASAKDILASLSTQTISGKSEINTDRVVAGLEIISPSITTKNLSLDSISLTSGSQLAVSLGKDGKMVIKGTGENGIIFDGEGNAFFAGTITAKSIKADSIEGLDIIAGRISSISDLVATLSASLAQNSSSETISSPSAVISQSSNFLTQNMILDSLGVSGLATFSADVRVRGNGLIEGILSVVDTLTTNNFLANGLATFFDNVVFKKNVSFEGHQELGKDSAGFAKINKGDSYVDIAYETEYDSLPVLNTTIVYDKLEKDDDQEDSDQKAILQNSDYVIVHRSKKGFRILLKNKATDDIQFTWTAVAVKDQASIFTSGKEAPPIHSSP